MKTTRSSSMMLFPFALLQLLAAAAAPSLAQSASFDFFYFVQQWQGGSCDKNQNCCYPTTGQPAADFGIHGLWPRYNDGSYPSNCDPNSEFDPEEMTHLIPLLESDWPTFACPSSDSTKLWEHEWKKHGTCSESVLSNPYKYFEAALRLNRQVVKLLQILLKAGITPENGRFYSLKSITDAITAALGFTPDITCNVDASGSSQLYQTYLCVDSLGSNLVKCPVLPRSLSRKKCDSEVEIPYFGGDDEISTVVSN